MAPKKGHFTKQVTGGVPKHQVVHGKVRQLLQAEGDHGLDNDGSKSPGPNPDPKTSLVGRHRTRASCL